ncbi:MAG TPA: GNAT family N-acetyltransferase [Gemmatimonadaceae bacterium]|nr:GNAT family N-acetyltransferase [Gemmatimonadaceae bacterium]
MTRTLTVGALTSSHRQDIERIVRATGVFSDAEVDVALELFDETFASPSRRSAEQAASAPDYEFLGAFDHRALVGYACFGPTPSTDRTYDLYWIAVHPAAQRTGAGAALMNEVERILSERRSRLIVIETSSRDDYAPTRRFYHGRGYEEAARLRDFYSPGDDRVVLTRRLTASAS